MAIASAGNRFRGPLTAAAALSSSASKVKAKPCPPKVCKFLGIPDPSARTRSPTALLISKFIRLHSTQIPGIKDRNWERNLKTLLHGKDRVGFPEVTRLLSPEFTYSTLKTTDTTTSFAKLEAKKVKGKKAAKK